MNNHKVSIVANKIASLIFTTLIFTTNASAQKNILIPVNTTYVIGIENLIHPSLVNKLYQISRNKLIWFLPNEQSPLLRRLLKAKIDSSGYLGLQKNKFHINELNQNADKVFSVKDSLAAMRADRIFTDAAIAFCKDLYQGADIGNCISYDELSPKYEESDNAYLVMNLAAVRSCSELLNFLNSLEPNNTEYFILKSEMQARYDSLSYFEKQQLTSSMNFCRWIHHFHFEKYMVVNIASATLRYYEFNTVKLTMKVVAGKPSTRTPRFTAHCDEIILYPYWNVPTTIALHELLPEFKTNPAKVDDLNMQLIDSKGNIIDHHKLNWRNYNKSYFPFRIRQSTGCDNSLGVIKFNLTSPLGIYLHDTNNKVAFMSGLRYYSHGCIRVEEPIGLANYLLPHPIDSLYLESCLRDQVPVPMSLLKPVPVFVVYQTAEANVAGKVKYYKDVYGLLK